MNQDSVWPSVVPVLPAAGRPPASLAPVPVPWSITPSSSRGTPRATCSSLTCLHRVFGSATSFLSLVVIEMRGLGWQYFPSAASVAYDDAMVSGVTESEPRVIAEGYGWIGAPLPWCNPRRPMFFSTEQPPSLTTSEAK